MTREKYTVDKVNKIHFLLKFNTRTTPELLIGLMQSETENETYKIDRDEAVRILETYGFTLKNNMYIRPKKLGLRIKTANRLHWYLRHGLTMNEIYSELNPNDNKYAADLLSSYLVLFGYPVPFNTSKPKSLEHRHSSKLRYVPRPKSKPRKPKPRFSRPKDYPKIKLDKVHSIFADNEKLSANLFIQLMLDGDNNYVIETDEAVETMRVYGYGYGIDVDHKDTDYMYNRPEYIKAKSRFASLLHEYLDCRMSKNTLIEMLNPGRKEVRFRYMNALMDIFGIYTIQPVQADADTDTVQADTNQAKG